MSGYLETKNLSVGYHGKPLIDYARCVDCMVCTETCQARAITSGARSWQALALWPRTLARRAWRRTLALRGLDGRMGRRGRQSDALARRGGRTRLGRSPASDDGHQRGVGRRLEQNRPTRVRRELGDQVFGKVIVEIRKLHGIGRWENRAIICHSAAGRGAGVWRIFHAGRRGWKILHVQSKYSEFAEKLPV